MSGVQTEAPRMTRAPGLVERTGSRLEPRHPSWLVAHPVTAGWLWIAAVTLLLISVDRMGAPWWLRGGVVLTAALPSFAATIAVLSQTPHSHLHHEESVLSHFLARFAGWVSAFVLWTASVVLSAAMAVQLTDDSGTSAIRTWEDAVAMLAVIVPFVIVVLWLALVSRYVFFLVRLRGWRAVPTRHRIPVSFLAEAPRTRRVVVGLAHPGLLLVAGLFTTVLALALAVEDLTHILG